MDQVPFLAHYLHAHHELVYVAFECGRLTGLPVSHGRHRIATSFGHATTDDKVAFAFWYIARQ
jgi:hypothetical protein